MATLSLGFFRVDEPTFGCASICNVPEPDAATARPRLTGAERPVPPLGSKAAALTLTALAVLTPWPMGGALPWASRAASVLALGVSAAVLVGSLWHRRPSLSLAPLWPLFALAGVGVLQLVPLPPALHAFVAPGSTALWHPSEPAVAEVLGATWKPISIHPLATRAALSWLFGLAALGALALPALRDRQWARGIGMGLVAGGLVVASFGVVARVAFGSLLFGHIAVPTVSPFGPFVSKNHFAGYVTAIALLSLGLAVGLADEARRDSSGLSWVRSSRAALTVVAFGATMLLFLGVLVSQSRGGALGLLAGALAFLLLRASQRSGAASRPKAVGVVATLALVGTLALAALLPDEARSRLRTIVGPPDSSGSFRLGLWRDSLAAFRTSPAAGQGLGAFADALAPRKTVAGELRVEHAENDFVEVLVEGGVAAAALVAAGLPLIFRLGLAARERHGLGRGLAMGAAAVLVGVAVHSFVDFPLRLPAVASAAALAVTLLAALGPRPQESPDPAPRPSAWPLRATLAGTLVLLAGQLVLPSSPTRAASLAEVRLVTRAGARPAPSRARVGEARLRQHLRARPGDAEGWMVLAWLRAAAGDHTAALALARHASRLDPTRESLQAYREDLETALQRGPR